MKPKIYLLTLILLLSAIVRLIFLNKIPTGINNDELHFVLNAKSIFYGFTNIEGKINPFRLKEISSFIFAPIIGPLPTNLFTARLPYALIGCLSVILIYQITLKFTKNTSLAIVSALIASINPWSIYVSRTSFDPPIAIFFFLLTIYLLGSLKPKYILLSLFTGFLAFHSYIATKLIYLPIILISSYFFWAKNHKKNTSIYLLVVIFSTLITLNYIFSIKKQLVGDRLSELQTPYSQSIADQVNLERRQSLQISYSKELLTNKYTVYIRNFIQKYLYNFSTDILFISGDHTTTGSLWKHGYFYYIDAILILFGLIYLYTKHPKFLTYLICLILLSPIPEALRADINPAYIFHSSLQFYFICILIATGVLFCWQTFSNRFPRYIFVLIYFFSFANFFDFYFFKAPIYQPESFVFSQHILSKYLTLETTKNNEIYILSQQPEVLFRSHLFYTNYYKKDKFNQIKDIYSKPTDNITFDNIHFINHTKFLPDQDTYTLTYDSINFNFQYSPSTLHISNLADTGNIYTINNGLTCQNLSLSTYPNNISLFDLNLNKLNELDFCQKYITIK